MITRVLSVFLLVSVCSSCINPKSPAQAACDVVASKPTPAPDAYGGKPLAPAPKAEVKVPGSIIFVYNPGTQMFVYRVIPVLRPITPKKIAEVEEKEAYLTFDRCSVIVPASSGTLAIDIIKANPNLFAVDGCDKVPDGYVRDSYVAMHVGELFSCDNKYVLDSKWVFTVSPDDPASNEFIPKPDKESFDGYVLLHPNTFPLQEIFYEEPVPVFVKAGNPLLGYIEASSNL